MIKEAYFVKLFDRWNLVKPAPESLIAALNSSDNIAETALYNTSTNTVVVNDSNDIFMFDSLDGGTVLITDKSPRCKAVAAILDSTLDLDIILYTQRVLGSYVYDDTRTRRVNQYCFIMYTIYKDNPQNVIIDKKATYTTGITEGIKKLDKIEEVLGCPLHYEYDNYEYGSVYVGENELYKRYLAEIEPKEMHRDNIDKEKLYKSITDNEKSWHEDE